MRGRSLHVSLEASRPLLDLTSYARRGPPEVMRLTAEEIAQIARTVGRTPEVMVKVSGGAKSRSAAVAHLRYIDRHGELEVEADTGEVLKGNGVAQELASDWVLDEADARMRRPYSGRPGPKPAKLLHHLVLSMPAGTPPARLMDAARVFAREQFALQHRYAMVLHTHQDHPHVHLAVKACASYCLLW